MSIVALVLWLLCGAPATWAFARHKRLRLGVAVLPFAAWLAVTLPRIASEAIGFSAAGWWWQALIAGSLLGLAVEALLQRVTPHVPLSPAPLERKVAWLGLALLVAVGMLHLAIGWSFTEGYPGYQWDGWIIWIAKAKVLADAPGPYLASIAGKQVERAHWDYPLLMPANLAWWRRIAGLQLKELSPVLAWFAAAVPLAGAVVLVRRVNPLLAVAVLLSPFTMPLMTRRHYGAFADGILVLTGTVALSWLLVAVRDRDGPLFVATGVVLANMVAIKNEGVLWAVAHVIAAVLLALDLGYGRRFAAAVVLWTAPIACLTFAAWRVAVAVAGISNPITSKPTLGAIGARLPTAVWRVVTEPLKAHNLWLLVPVVLALIVYCPGSPLKRLRRIAVFLVAPAVFMLGLIFVYVITPYDFDWHLNRSLWRVIWGVVPAIFAVTLLLGRSPTDQRA